LIADAHSKLQRLIELDREQRAKAKRWLKDRGRQKDETMAKAKEHLAERLIELGLSARDAEAFDEEWEARRKEAERRSKEILERFQSTYEEHRERMLDELRTQTELLRSIVAKLEG